MLANFKRPDNILQEICSFSALHPAYTDYPIESVPRATINGHEVETTDEISRFEHTDFYFHEPESVFPLVRVFDDAARR